MARSIFGVHLDLNQNELQQGVFHRLSSAPTSPTGGQVYFDTTLEIPRYYNAASGAWYSMSAVASSASWAGMVGGTSNNETFIVGSGSILSPTGAGIIDANRYNGNSIISVVDGGLGTSGIINGRLLVGNDFSSPFTSALLTYATGNISGLRVNTSATLGVLNLGSSTGYPQIYWEPATLTTTASGNTVEYDGSDIYYTNNIGTRYKVASTTTNLSEFGGLLPISKGGTNTSAITNNSLLKSANTTVTGFVGAGSGQIAMWDGSNWISSSGFIATRPSGSYNKIIVASGNAGLLIDASDYGEFTRPLLTISVTGYPILNVSKAGVVHVQPGYISFGNNGQVSLADTTEYVGGTLDASAGASGDGGELTVGNDGGDINTTLGYMEFGQSLARVRVERQSGTGAGTLVLPYQYGTVIVGTGIYSGASGTVLAWNGLTWLNASGSFGGSGVGPAGPSGAPGPTGEQGIQGVPGVPGDPGLFNRNGWASGTIYGMNDGVFASGSYFISLTTGNLNNIPYNTIGSYWSYMASGYSQAITDVDINTLAGTLAINKGGTSNTTATGAINALLPTQSSGSVLISNGSNILWIASGSLGTAGGGGGITTFVDTTGAILRQPAGADGNYNTISVGSGYRGLSVSGTAQDFIKHLFSISNTGSLIFEIQKDGTTTFPRGGFTLGAGAEWSAVHTESTNGGSINLNAGDNGDGGTLTMNDDGGHINTNSGYMQFGISNSRITLVKSTGNGLIEIKLPFKHDTIVVGTGLYSGSSGNILTWDGLHYRPNTLSINSLLPSQGSASGYLLASDGSNVLWIPSGLIGGGGGGGISSFAGPTGAIVRQPAGSDLTYNTIVVNSGYLGLSVSGAVGDFSVPLVQISQTGSILFQILKDGTISFPGGGFIVGEQGDWSAQDFAGNVGGNINLSAGSSGNGGWLILNNDGGSLNTNSGYVGFGVSSSRVTLSKSTGVGTAEIKMPLVTDTMVVGTGLYGTSSGNILTWDGSHYRPNTLSINTLLPSQGSASGSVLVSDGSNVSWVSSGLLGGGGGGGFDSSVFASGSLIKSYGSNLTGFVGSTSGAMPKWNGTTWVSATGFLQYSTLKVFLFSSGDYAYVQVPYYAEIQNFTIAGYNSRGIPTTGSVIVDIWKDTTANYPPTVADTITASVQPTISTGTGPTANDTLVGWNRVITAGDWLVFKPSVFSLFDKVELQLLLLRV